MLVCTVFKQACKGHFDNCHYMMFSNKISLLIELLIHQLTVGYSSCLLVFAVSFAFVFSRLVLSFLSFTSALNPHSAQLVERPLFDREVAGSIPSRVIPKTLKMVLAAL